MGVTALLLLPLAWALCDVRLTTDATPLTIGAPQVHVKADTTTVSAGGVVPSPDREILTVIQVQGNVVTSDDEVRRLAGVEIGMPIGPGIEDDVAHRLRATKRFEHVEIRKRFASIADSTQVALVIIVDEGPVSIEMTGDPSRPTRVVRSRRLNMLFLPVLDAEDGYGLTYGVRLAMRDIAGENSRLTFPLTWGGEKRAGIDIDKTFARGPISRVVASGGVTRRTNPFFEEDDDRSRASIRGEHAFNHVVHVGAGAGWQHVSFLGADESFLHAGADLVVDTRLDPMLARNAVYARTAWDRFALSGGGVNRFEVDARGYIGLPGRQILVLRVLRDDADKPLQPYLRPLLGGTANLRGFEAGSAIGDTLLARSAELIVPLSSPFRFGTVGVSAFVDEGVIYNKGERLTDQMARRGFGGSVWLAAVFVRVNLAIAHGVGAATRVHVGGAVSF